MAGRLEGPGSEERLKRAQQGFRGASREMRWRGFVRRWWVWGVLIAAAALYLWWTRTSGSGL